MTGVCSQLHSENVHSTTDMINKKLCAFCCRARGSETPRSKSTNNGRPTRRERFRPSAASPRARPPPRRASSPRRIPPPALALVRLISKSRWVQVINQVAGRRCSVWIPRGEDYDRSNRGCRAKRDRRYFPRKTNKILSRLYATKAPIYSFLWCKSCPLKCAPRSTKTLQSTSTIQDFVVHIGRRLNRGWALARTHRYTHASGDMRICIQYRSRFRPGDNARLLHLEYFSMQIRVLFFGRANYFRTLLGQHRRFLSKR